MPHEVGEILEIRQWLIKAKHDWAVAMQIVHAGGVETDVAAFHCQQAVEKLLKAYLVSRRLPFEKVHDLRLLLNHCSPSEPGFDSLRDSVEPLTLYAVAYRYPGPAEPSLTEVERALGVVRTVWTFVIRRLPEEATRDIDG
jgi:HEPN domain-containing protein